MDQGGDGPESKLRRWIEQRLGGTIVSMERQARWRPAWFAEVETADGRMPIYVRSRREQAELLFFPLAHEAEVLRVLHAAGIPSPKIYGLCDDPEAIVMDRMPGGPILPPPTARQRRPRCCSISSRSWRGCMPCRRRIS